MNYDIILAGVGGQGILTVAYVLDNAALAKGLRFKQAEVHGMAQRGGAVQSHLRIADHDIHSDLIPRGRADMILAVEPLESLRYDDFLKPDGIVIANLESYVNIPDYPDYDEVIAKVQQHERHLLVDAKRLARAAGSARSENIVMVGAAADLLPTDYADYGTYIQELFGRKGEAVVAANNLAMAYGRGASLLYKAGLELDLPAAALVLMAKTLVCDACDADSAKATAAASRALFAGDEGKRFRELLPDFKGSLKADPAVFDKLTGDISLDTLNEVAL